MNSIIKKSFQQSIDLKKSILESEELLSKIDKVSSTIIQGFKQKNQVLFCGNGGSAGDAQHIAAELSGRFYFDRPPLDAEALHVNSSYLTAVANDYSYDIIYERLIEAKGKPGDILFGISTSGNSENILRALIKAKELGLVTIGLTGETGGKMKDHVDILVNVPSKDTPRIQEVHILIGHIICEIVEANLFSEKKS